MTDTPKKPLSDPPISVKLKLSLLWASLMFLYIYNDFISLYLPGTLDDVAAGSMGPLGQANDWLLLGVAVLVGLPGLMIFLSSGLPAAISRWANIVVGTLYTVVEIATFFDSALFYQVVVVTEIALTVAIVWHAVKWPREIS